MSLLDQVTTTIDNYGMLNSGDRLVVAVSGGPDSLALLHLLTRLQEDYQLKLHIAHLNHQLRGEVAAQEAQFVKKIATSWQLPVTVESRDVQSFQQEAGLSLEDAARKVRYDFLWELLAELKFDKLVVGHHADDQAETVLLKFLRGAGLQGLGGIVPNRNKLIRPLIEVSKQELKDYCAQYNLNPCSDETNLEPIYQRNKIRLELLPLLKQDYNANLVNTLNRMARILRAEEDYLSDHATDILQEITIRESKTELIINRRSFLELHIALQRRIIREAIRYLQGDCQDIYYQHIQDIIDLTSNSDTGKKLELPDELLVRLNYNQLILATKELVATKEDFNYQLTRGKVKVPELDLVISSKVVASDYPWQEELADPQVGCFDYDSVGPQFYVRTRKPGDRFYPLGMEGSKKVKDFFIDEKIPVWQREQIPILTTKQGTVFWVGGLRVDDRFKITKDTQQILIIKIKEGL
ncbi:tRNA lysidine(34) synthetase TilS [Halanaerobaculum tunisiense]